MEQLELWMRKHPKATLQVFIAESGIVVARLYDNERGNHIAGGQGTTLAMALDQAYVNAAKG